MENTKIKNRLLRSGPVDWQAFQFIQTETFKEMKADEFEKLLESIISNGFVESFKVWQDTDGVVYCLDGFHRCKGLAWLKENAFKGVRYQVPETFQGDFIDCVDREEAARLVLIYSSRYARITEEGLYEYLNLNNLTLGDVAPVIDIPDIDMGSFELNFYKDFMPGGGKKDVSFQAGEKDPFDDEGVGYKSQFGVIVMCADEAEQQKVFDRLSAEGFSCKIVVT